jgi:hypothetical protein
MHFAVRSLGLLTVALAGSTTTALPTADPPARIARVGFLTGSISFRPSGHDQWAPASPRYPLTSGAELWSDNSGRAEVHIGGSTAWLGARTLVDFRDVADHATQLRVTQGVLYVRVPRLAKSDSYDIDTPSGTVSLLGEGAYRIDVAPNGLKSSITVREGRAEVSSRTDSILLHSGESLVIAERNAPLPGARVALAMDEWERWAEWRGMLDDQSLSLRYLSPDIVGFEALDGYGTWRMDQDFGPVWVPVVSAGWAPYRFGSWAWVDPWGWTWIDDAPWGFAPSHYGRWAFLQNRWAWVPGGIMGQPVYAPALVGFLEGSGFDVSVSLGNTGALGWFPLAPGEIYIPPFRVSEAYVREINMSTVKVNAVDFSSLDSRKISYRYRSLPSAVTVVSKRTFASGAPVSTAVLRLPSGALTKATMIGTTAPIVHSKPTVLPRSPVPSAPRPPAAALKGQVIPGGVPSQSERDRLLEQQAVERAELESRQRSELTRIHSADSGQQLQRRQAQEQAELTRRHQAELQSLDRKRRA